MDPKLTLFKTGLLALLAISSVVTASPDVEGNTISWPDDGDWWQVQTLDGSRTFCDGSINCNVPAGRYVVINHTTGERFDNVLIKGSLPSELPLGRRGLTEQWSEEQLAPGLIHRRIERGGDSTGDGFILESAPTLDLIDAQEWVVNLNAQGITAWLDRASENSDKGSPIYIVRTGFASSEQAVDVQSTFESVAGSAALRTLSDTGEPDTDGPWIVNVLEVDLETYPGRVTTALAGGIVPGGANVAEIALQSGQVDAAINASFFVFRDDWGGTTGRPAGLFVNAGRLASESIDGRPVLAVNTKEAALYTNVTTRVAVTLSGKELIADGVNRKPGRTVNCGNIGDEQGEVAAHDYFCDDGDEIIIFNSLFGSTSDAGAGVELVVEAGLITSIRNIRGGNIPANGFTIQATGGQAAQLMELASIGSPADWDFALSSNGIEIDPTNWSFLINGGPTLLANSQLPPVAQRGAEGWSELFGDVDRTAFYYGWVLRRHPRSAVGISSDGKTLYLVTVDGRQPGISVGATISEMGWLMRDLGASQAINLDGGGSTTLLISDTIANQSSDAEPRAVADAILLVRD